MTDQQMHGNGKVEDGPRDYNHTIKLVLSGFENTKLI